MNMNKLICMIAVIVAPLVGAARHRYQHYRSGSSVLQAKAHALCEEHGGWLASIVTKDDAAQLIADVGTPPPWTSAAMLAGSDDHREGEWIWKYGPRAGTVFYTKSGGCKQEYCNWSPNEPNNYGIEHTMYVWRGSEFTWNDDDDGDIGDFVCEFGTSTATATLPEVPPRTRTVSLPMTTPAPMTSPEPVQYG